LREEERKPEKPIKSKDEVNVSKVEIDGIRLL